MGGIGRKFAIRLKELSNLAIISLIVRMRSSISSPVPLEVSLSLRFSEVML